MFYITIKIQFEQPSNVCLLFNRPSRFESSDSENNQQEVELNGQQQTRKSPQRFQKKIAPPSLPSFQTPQSLPIPIKTTKTKVTSSSTTSLFDKIPSSSSKVGNDYVPISNFVYIHVQVYTIN